MEVIENNEFVSTYFMHVRSEISDHIAIGNHRVLDVGCGAGFLGENLKQKGCASEVVGIEINPKVAEQASQKLDKVICEDLNKVTVAELLSREQMGSFDYIICADVLEHLIDPWQAITQLKQYLVPGGRMIVSLPNVRHWSVWIPLVLKGRWDYKDAGIMDRTHLRFFTSATALGMFADARLDVIEKHPLIGGKWRWVDKLSMQLLRELVAVQWVFVVELKAGK